MSRDLFRPCIPNTYELSTVFGLIIPGIHGASLEKDFADFVKKLPKCVFVKGEPKGHKLTLGHHKSLVEILNSHRGVMSVPITFNREIESNSFSAWPQALRELLNNEASQCIHETMRVQVESLANRCGNLSPDQISRLMAYKIGVEKALSGICLFYHCAKYHELYGDIKILFDRTGRANSREELVFKEIIFVWVNKNTFVSVKQIHTEQHPFVRQYGTRINGQRAFDLGKMIRGNFDFRDSKTTWQLQLVDMLAAGWINAVKDRKNESGYLSLFRKLHGNSVHPNDQPIGMISVADRSGQTYAPRQFNIFRRLVRNTGKFLPCPWD